MLTDVVSCVQRAYHQEKWGSPYFRGVVFLSKWLIKWLKHWILNVYTFQISILCVWVCACARVSRSLYPVSSSTWMCEKITGDDYSIIKGNCVPVKVLHFPTQWFITTELEHVEHSPSTQIIKYKFSSHLSILTLIQASVLYL